MGFLSDSALWRFSNPSLSSHPHTRGGDSSSASTSCRSLHHLSIALCLTFTFVTISLLTSPHLCWDAGQHTHLCQIEGLYSPWTWDLVDLWPRKRSLPHLPPPGKILPTVQSVSKPSQFAGKSWGVSSSHEGAGPENSLGNGTPPHPDCMGSKEDLTHPPEDRRQLVSLCDYNGLKLLRISYWALEVMLSMSFISMPPTS